MAVIGFVTRCSPLCEIRNCCSFELASRMPMNLCLNKIRCVELTYVEKTYEEKEASGALDNTDGFIQT